MLQPGMSVAGIYGSVVAPRVHALQPPAESARSLLPGDGARGEDSVNGLLQVEIGESTVTTRFSMSKYPSTPFWAAGLGLKPYHPKYRTLSPKRPSTTRIPVAGFS